MKGGCSVILAGLIGVAWPQASLSAVSAGSQDPNQKVQAPAQRLHRILLSSFVLPPKRPSYGKLRRPDADGIIAAHARVAADFAAGAHVSTGDVVVSFTRGNKLPHSSGRPALGRLAQISGLLVIEQVDGRRGMARVVEPLTEIESGHELMRIEDVLPDMASDEPTGNQPHAFDALLRRTVEAHPASVALEGEVVAIERQALVAGYQRLIFVDRGRADGLKVGDRLTLQPRPNSRKGMPDLILGEAVVVSLAERFATCWLTLAHLEIGAGDRFLTQTTAEKK